ncbi:uricase-like [Mercenaria mercenaria]|uniref:uricase-like n=1 Tax=Mercenaria mercenaria TaxID=6596 RepID=UPI00234EA240|nr:uricase-like [Mercenaria mercenaria]
MSKPVKLEFLSTDWGKNWIKLLVVKKEEGKQFIKEMEVSTSLTLENRRDYTVADNSEVIATDSQKNIVHVLAKQHLIQSIEGFAMLLCSHFLTTYPQLVSTKIKIEECPWKRMEINDEMHIHAFQYVKDCVRVCEVSQNRNEQPIVCSGIRELRVLKTTQSAFKGFVDDEYRTLPYSDDRIFSSVISANWWYGSCFRFDFDTIWQTVKKTLLEGFAGPADKGVFSANVENTLYETAKTALSKIPQIKQMEITLPNKHYFEVDFSKFPKLDFDGCFNRESPFRQWVPRLSIESFWQQGSFRPEGLNLGLDPSEIWWQ